MLKYNVSALRGSLPGLLARVEKQGAEVIVTRRGRPVARLVPIDKRGRSQEHTPLRSVPIRLASDFDAPLDHLWEDLPK